MHQHRRASEGFTSARAEEAAEIESLATVALQQKEGSFIMRESVNRESSADNDRSMLRSWHEWEVKDGERQIILCVETGLELRPGFPGFDPMELEALILNATDMMRTSASPIDAIRIVPPR